MKIWKALREPISILRANERLWTILLSGVLENINVDKDTMISIELTYSDIEGTTFPPEEFKLDLFPNDGALFTTKKRFTNRSLIEEAELRPNF